MRKWVRRGALLFLVAGLFLMLALGMFIYGLFRAPSLTVADGSTVLEAAEQIDEWLSSLQKNGKFNGAVLIAQNGQPLLMNAYGFADHRLKTPLTKQSSFRLASVSKQFTAAGILVLVDQGTVDLDAPVATYLEEFPFPEVTIRHLLNHTSGIPDCYMEMAEAHRKSLEEPLKISDVVSLIHDFPPSATAKPNQRFEYSNTGYVLLAAVIEVVGKRGFEQFMNDELFAPLGMENTRVWNLVSEQSTFSNQAGEFMQIAGTVTIVEPTWIDGVAGDGAVFSSVEDLLIWDSFWRDNDLLLPETMNEAFVKPKLAGGAISDYGFGWLITGTGHWHNGLYLAANTYISRHVNDGLCIVVLDNSFNTRAPNIASQIDEAVVKAARIKP